MFGYFKQKCLVTIEENGVPGGLKMIFEGRTPANGPQYTIVLLLDLGFIKYGFDHANRR